MAEAFAALGIAANIFQFLELGLKTTRTIVATYRSVDIDGLAQHTADLSLSASDFRKQCAQLKSDIEIAKDKSLVTLLTRCVDTAKDINKEIAGLKIPKSKRGKTWSRLWFGLKASWKSSKIEGLQADLVEMRGEICIRLQGLIFEHQKSLSRSMGSLGQASKAWNTATTQRLDVMARQIGDLLAAREASATVTAESDRQYAELASSLEKFASEAKNHGLIRAILQSLHFAQIKERQNEIPVAHKNTFEWVFREDSTTTFPAWLRGSSGLFWITGKPGSGKSTLMKFIMSHQKTTQLAETWAGPKRLLLASHFFWYGGTKIQQSQEGLLRTLLFQILVNYPEFVHDLFPERSGDSFKYLESWSLEELSAAFGFLTEHPNMPCRILILVDGLDEYIGEKKGLTKFLRAVAESPNIKVCCASRPWPEFQKAFGGSSAQIEMHDLTKDDMRLYVRDELEKDETFQKIKSSQSSQAEALVESISSRAEGVFFWVFLVVKSLLKGLGYKDDPESLQLRVLEFPKDLDKFFKRMIDSIDGVHKQRVHDVFSALLMARAPLPLVFFLAQDSLEDLRNNWAENFDSVENSESKLSHRLRIANAFEGGKTGMKTGWKRGFAGRGMPDYRGEINFEDNIDKRSLDSIPSADRMQEYKDTLLWQCCDLVQAWKVDTEAPAGFSIRIGFLHRTVIEFLQQTNYALSSDNKRRYLRYIHARSFLEIVLLELTPTFANEHIANEHIPKEYIANEYTLRFIHAIQETETDIGGWTNDGYQILDICSRIQKILTLIEEPRFDVRQPQLYSPVDWQPTLRLLSSVQARILVQKYNWELTYQSGDKFLHLYENKNSPQIIHHILEGSSSIDIGDSVTSTTLKVIDLDLLGNILCLDGFKKLIMASCLGRQSMI
ncbi:hypothetical protein CSOJ01_06497 [Colletotrichum sojae]|uniref:Nephrocystin 3-like N-terminal domain-containing protein n=1 Tax=Colletotrichum sojae TaxID=2175907 RepID=A0A8H6JBN2_9PEZI|nr:hypothetical protein CSOJ01_06497 [Colletotrichum sojae]